MSKRRRRKHIGTRPNGEQWIRHPLALIRILRELNLTERRLIDTLEVEHCRHGGRNNGRLISTYADFERGGARRKSIRGALSVLKAAGLIEITRPGRRSYADLRSPSMYRLTYLPTFQEGKEVDPTHDWKKQKARGDLSTGARGDLPTGNNEKPGAIRPLREAESQGRYDHSYLDLGEEGGGAVADYSSLTVSLPAASQRGAGPSVSPPASDGDQRPSVTAPSSGRLH
jgi:hypothetical protein